VGVALTFEDLSVLQAAEAVADGIWRQVVRWDPFAREVAGGQLARAVDSIGANIAEAFGRFTLERSSSSCIMPVAASSKPSTGSTGHEHAI